MRDLLLAVCIIGVLFGGVAAIEASPSSAVDPVGRAPPPNPIATADSWIAGAGSWCWIAIAVNPNDPTFHGRSLAAGARLILSPMSGDIRPEDTPI